MAAALAAAPPAAAQAEEEGWHVVVAPYVWGGALDGSAVVRGRKADIDLSSKDIRDHLDHSFMGAAAVQNGKWGLVGDVVWVDLGVKVDFPPADVDPTLGIVSLQGVRKLGELADLTFGARYNRLKGQIKVRGPGPLGFEVEKTRDWIDPVVGLVLRTPGEGRLHGKLIADVGGFGVGSKLSWQLFPSVGVQVTRHTSVELGWRMLYTDYSADHGSQRFEYDTLLQGPVAGFVFKF